MAESAKSVARLCTDRGMDLRTLAERSGVDEQRLMAIVLGRWTPSPRTVMPSPPSSASRAMRSPGGTRRRFSTSMGRGRRDGFASCQWTVDS